MVANVPLGQLIQTLRIAAGQDPDGTTAAETEAAAIEYGHEMPAWVRDARIVETIDADAMLEHGEHPIGRIQKLLAALQPAEVVCLIASFRPEPLLQLVKQKGFEVHAEVGPGGRSRFLVGRR